MARIAQEILEGLKRDVSVQRLVEARGVKLSPHGENLLGHCPFHDDKTPSLVVTPKKNLWHCLGACRSGGSVVDWVMKAEGVAFRHAVELLREGISLEGPVGPRVATVPRLPCPLDADADDATLLGQVVGYYQQQLKASPEALAYLETRGLKHTGAIETFKLGFANRTLGLRLPDANRLEGAKLRGRLQALGVMRESGHEHLNGSLVVPLMNETGEVKSLYGRKVGGGLKPGTPLHLYLPGPHPVAFNSGALAGQKSAIVCEAVLDALSFWVAGFRNVTAAYGVEGFTPHHLEALRRHDVKDVLIAYDRDDAGDAAAEALSKRLLAEGFNCWRVLFPRGMDANEYAVKVQPAAKSLGMALRQALWMGSAAKAPPLPEVAVAAATALSIETVPALPSLAAQVPLPAVTPPPTEVPLALVEKEPVPVPKAVSVVSAPGEVFPALHPLPVLPKAPDVEAEVSAEEVVMHLGGRRYRVRGLPKALSAESLKLNLLVSVGEAFHVDTVELYSARQRAAFVKQAAEELRAPEEALKRDMAALLLKLEALQEAKLKEKLAPKNAAPSLSEAERDAALELLKSPQLLQRILADFEACGVVGEETNKLVGYLAAVSRKLDAPLAVLLQSSSAAGKTSLMEAVLAFVPEEEKTKYSAMTGQSLFYMGDADLKNKVLAIVEEEGASRASYALKLLQSEGELTIASTGKNPSTGRLETHEYRVEGPAQLFLTTTAVELDEELLNRCLVLTVDEDRPQTQAIHRLQREKQTLEGLVAKRQRAALLSLHQNAQRLLRPLLVANPFAHSLTFLDDRTRTRRDFPKYLTLIQTLALLHQHQRPVKTVQHGNQVLEYVEATLEDVAVANRLAHQVLGRSLDELAPQARRLLNTVYARVDEACAAQKLHRTEFRFSRKEVRAWTGWSDFQVRMHLTKLVSLEYLLAHRGQRGQTFVYECLYDGQGKDGAAFLMGLVDVETLRHGYEAKNEHRKADFEGATSTHRASNEPPLRAVENGAGAGNDSHSPQVTVSKGFPAHLREENSAASYVQVRV